MPSRIIRESALTSHSLSLLSDGAERLFWRLTIVADDHGRFDAYPQTVKSRCFPTLVDKLKTERVRQWLIELGADHCLFYTVGTRAYGQFHKWAEYQRQYGLSSKFPQPPAECGKSPQDPALILIRETISERRESRVENRESIYAHQVVSDFDRFWSEYPKKVGKKPAHNAWGKIKDRPPIETILAAITTAKHTEDWIKDGGQFIPYPAKWIDQCRWADEPTVKPRSTMENFLSRRPRQEEP